MPYAATLLLIANALRATGLPANTAIAPTEEEAPETDEQMWGGEALIGGNVAFPGPELQESTDILGLGFNVYGGVRYRKFPLLLGLNLGVDTFLPRHASFSYAGTDAYWRLRRESMLIAPSLRLLPRDWSVRPYVDALAGVWLHWVGLEAEYPWEEESHHLGTEGTGAYGLGAGLLVDLSEKVVLGIAGRYLCGGGITVPDLNSATVINGRLYFDDVTTDSIDQWSFGLEIGGRL